MQKRSSRGASKTLSKTLSNKFFGAPARALYARVLFCKTLVFAEPLCAPNRSALLSAHTSLRVEAPVRPLMACTCLILLDAFPSLLAACLACPLLLRAPPPSPTSAFWEPFKRVPSNAGFWELPSSLPMCLSPNMRYTTFGCPSAPPFPSPCRGPKSRTTPQAARPL